MGYRPPQREAGCVWAPGCRRGWKPVNRDRAGPGPAAARCLLRASIAMEDAVILARHLAAAAPEAIPRALAAFDRERQPRAGKLAKMAASNRDAKTAGSIGARMREMVMPHVMSSTFSTPAWPLAARPHR